MVGASGIAKFSIERGVSEAPGPMFLGIPPQSSGRSQAWPSVCSWPRRMGADVNHDPDAGAAMAACPRQTYGGEDE